MVPGTVTTRFWSFAKLTGLHGRIGTNNTKKTENGKEMVNPKNLSKPYI